MNVLFLLEFSCTHYQSTYFIQFSGSFKSFCMTRQMLYTYAAVNGHLEVPLVKDRQRFDAVSTSNLEVHKFRDWWILTYFIFGHVESSLNNIWSMVNVQRTCVLLLYYCLCLKANFDLEKTNHVGESSPNFIFAVVNLDLIVLEKRWIDGESWPNDFVEKVNRGEDLRWVGSRCTLTHALVNIISAPISSCIKSSKYDTRFLQLCIWHLILRCRSLNLIKMKWNFNSFNHFKWNRLITFMQPSMANLNSPTSRVVKDSMPFRCRTLMCINFGNGESSPNQFLDVVNLYLIKFKERWILSERAFYYFIILFILKWILT